MAARMLLPAFGGTAAVWTTSIVFFQIALLIGYLYAHILRKYCTPMVAGIVHVAFMIVGLAFLGFEQLRQAEASSTMVQEVFWQLARSIGLAFVGLSATSPLVQAWQNSTNQSTNTYRLYAWSNFGSLLALLSYPLIVERFGLSLQSIFWTWMVWFYLFLIAVCVWSVRTNRTWLDKLEPSAHRAKSHPLLFVVWLSLSAIASIMLVANTNVLCQEVASHPFLWVLPLVMYLLSLMLCFDGTGWYQRIVYLPSFAVTVFAAVLLHHLGPKAGLLFQATGFSLLTFFGGMICHGELYKLKPTGEQLTTFYLAMSLGGAMGGVFAAVVAPRIFSTYFEFHVALLACLAITAGLMIFEWLYRGQNRGEDNSYAMYGGVFVAAIAALPVVCSLMFFTNREFQPELSFRARNEYGVVSVTEQDGLRKMINGQTHHGGQYVDESRQQVPFAYYSSGSGVSVAFDYLRTAPKTDLLMTNKMANKNQGLNVGIIGLGTGAMLAYQQPGDQFKFYEINPLSEFAAREYFDYLTPEIEVVIGDGRKQLQLESDRGIGNGFDVLFVDAFTSDSIPTHLLTLEAVDLYLQQAAGGLLVFHITNRFVDLRPVLKAIADHHNLDSTMIEHENLEFDLQTRWVLMWRSDPLDIQPAPEWQQGIEPVVWTDDKAPLFPVVDWSGNLADRKH